MAKSNQKVSIDVDYMAESDGFSGTMVLELFDKEAPKTVENFLQYVKDGFFVGTIFHRVIPGFMIQAGGHDIDMTEKKAGDPIQNEAHNKVKNERGTIAMARTSDVHSATAQFFINLADNDFLDFQNDSPQGYGYAVFGKVTDGLDIVDKIAAVETGQSGMHGDVPVEAVVITGVSVVD